MLCCQVAEQIRSESQKETEEEFRNTRLWRHVSLHKPKRKTPVWSGPKIKVTGKLQARAQALLRERQEKIGFPV